MKHPRRFIVSIVTTARTGAPRLPFERGAPRAAMIARRQAAQDDKPVSARRSKSA
ncbi:hypothetical protein [Maliponia aquimaris]|uniref:Uncharacterized protein n=1 Tax=Maliponia aquimaris TaxID=1673631 RepID=A0A238K9U1_9RHOB|nr:hypothetical protein [Maliponia aquimaris]SMX39154.1 hypothetical protein MAA8898_01907 [Maliponia aquimaris]